MKLSIYDRASSSSKRSAKVSTGVLKVYLPHIDLDLPCCRHDDLSDNYALGCLEIP